MLPVPVQFHTFLVTSLTGIALAFLLDVGRVARHLARPRGLAAHGGDLVLWAAAALVAAAGLYLASWGEVRYYALVGGGLGVGVYFALASTTVLWVLERVLRRLAAVWRAVSGRIRRAVRAVRRFLAFLGRGLGRFSRTFARAAGLPGRLWRKVFPPRPPAGAGS